MDFMKQKQMKRTLYCLLLSALGITTSCVDNSYDLTKDIDMTVTIGGDLTTPGSSSDSIKLKELLDIDTENSDLKEEPNGDYVLKIDGDPTNSTVSVNKVTIAAYTSDDKNESDKIEFDLSDGDDSKTAPIMGLNPSMKLQQKDEVPEDVVDLEYATIDGSGRVLLRLDIIGDAKRVTLKEGLQFVFPEFITIKENAYFKKDDPSKNILSLRDNYTIEKNVGAQWFFEVEKIYFKAGYNGVPSGQGFIKRDENNNIPASINFDVEVPIQGDVIVQKSDFPRSTGKVGFQLVGKVSSQQMTLGEVRALVDPVIDFNVSDVTIEDLPDFLTDNKVVADLDNPQVLLNVKNTAEVDVNFQAVLSSYKGGENKARIIVGTDTATNNESTIRLKGGSTVNKICLSPKKEDVPEGYTWVQVAGLPSLVRDIPDLIKVEDIDAKVLPNFYTVVLGVDKIVNTDYELNAPLKFGKDFQIVYNDTINGWTEDIEDYEMKEVVVTLNAKNTIPLNLDIEAFALDVNGNEMPDVKIEVEGNIAAAEKDEQTGETKEKTSALTITLTKDDGSRIKNLDGLILRLTGCAVPEDKREEVTDFDAQILNANQTLKLEDLKLRIKGGVTMDLN